MKKIFLVLSILFTTISISSTFAKPIAISNNINGLNAQGDSFSASASSDGKWIVFTSYAEDLVSNDTNFYSDIFIYNTETGQTNKITQGLNGEQTNGNSLSPSISDDGRFVVYKSQALNLVNDNIYSQPPNSSSGIDTLWGQFQIFLFDRENNTTQRISAKNTSNRRVYLGDKNPQISADGQFITYIQEVSGDLDIIRQYDIETQAHININTSNCHSGGKIFTLNTSSNGRFITFTQGDSKTADVCLYDSYRQYSRSIYQQTNREIFDPQGNTNHPDISDNGRYIVFETYKIDSFGGTDSIISTLSLDTIFLYDTIFSGLHTLYQDQGEHIWYVYDTVGENIYDLDGRRSLAPSISNDARYVLFSGSNQNDIGDQNQTADAFVYDIINRTTQRITFSINGHAPNAQSQSIWMGGLNQQALVIISQASDLIENDVNHSRDIFLIDIHAFSAQPIASKQFAQSGDNLSITFPVSENSSGYYFGIETPKQETFIFNQSSQLVSFNEILPNNTLFFDDLSIEIAISEQFSPGTYSLWSMPAETQASVFELNSDSLLKTKIQVNPVAISQIIKKDITGGCDGVLSKNLQYTSFSSTEGFVSEDNNNSDDIYICHIESGETMRISVDEKGQQFNNSSSTYSIDDNTQWIAFAAFPEANSLSSQLYLYDFENNSSTQLLADLNLGYLLNLTISGDAKSILFQSTQENIVDNIDPENYGLYLWEQDSNQVKFIADRVSYDSAISFDGSTVVFSSSATNLTENKHSSDSSNLYLYDNISGKLIKLSNSLINLTDPSVQPFFTSKFRTSDPKISKNGQVIAYQFVPTIGLIQSPNIPYLAVYDRQNKRNEILKIGTSDELLSGQFYDVSLNDDGRFITFHSNQTFPVENSQTASQPGFNFYLYDRLNQQLKLLGHSSKYLFQGINISGDGYSYQLGDNLYGFIDRPFLNKTSWKTGETIQISIPETIPGYSQYFALEYPDGNLQIYTSKTSNYQHTGDVLIPYQGERQIVNQPIDLNTFLPGEYKAYLLNLASAVSATSLAIDSIATNGQLGISLFSIEP